MQYQSKYIGDNSNTGQLIGSLPFSEYGYVFEIDSENLGVIIDYHFTDWYNNEHLYTEKSLIYNSVSMFALIDNLEYIKFNFSGSSFSITRDVFEKNYPDYRKIFKDGKINVENFHQYVDKNINDRSFILNIIKLFE